MDDPPKFRRGGSVPADISHQETTKKKGVAKSREALDRALDKIFHPPKFDIRALSQDPEGNVDEGVKFYHPPSGGAGSFLAASVASIAAAPMPSQVAAGAEGAAGPVPFRPPLFHRTASLIEAPVTDSGFKKNLTQGSFQSYMKAVSEHNKDLYPHYHHVMSRMTPGMLKRAETDATFKTYDRGHKKKSRKISDTHTPKLPTITDAEKEEDEERIHKRDLTQEIYEETPKEVSQTKDDRQGKKAAFSIAPLDEDIDSDGSTGKAKLIYQRVVSQESGDELKKVSFSGGLTTASSQAEDEDEAGENAGKDRSKKKKKHRHRRLVPLESDLLFRRTKGSELQLDQHAMPTEEDEARGLVNRDVEDMASHRMDHLHGLSRHIIRRGSEAAMFQVSGLPDTQEQADCLNKMYETMYGDKAKQLDHSPHDLFVEMDELQDEEWVEMARWIKYEEDREEGAERWGKAHISSLSFHSLINLRLCLESGVIILDLEARDLPGVVYRVVEELHIDGVIEEEQKGEVLRVLLYRHKYVSDKTSFNLAGIKRNISQKSLNSFATSHHEDVGVGGDGGGDGGGPVEPLRWLRSFSREASFLGLGNLHHHRQNNRPELSRAESFITRMPHEPKSSKFRLGDVRRSETQSLLAENEKKSGVQISKHHTFIATHNGSAMDKDGDHLVSDVEQGEILKNQSLADLYRSAQNKKESILRRLKEGTEGTIALVGALKSLKRPAVALVRLAEGIVMPNALEVPLPMRFIFILLTPKPSPDMDFHEVGRSFSTLMSNPKFHTECYRVEERKELLSAINEFLDESVVLPPGDWDSKNLLSINEIQEMRRRRKNRMEEIEEDEYDQEEVAEAVVTHPEKKEDDDQKKNQYNPLVRTGVPFGGVINDIKRRAPWYLSDFTDAMNAQCVAAALFIYFACLSGAVAFGGLTATKTKNLIGIPETLIVSCVSGVLFALFAGQPLIITGVTGPVLLFDEALFKFAEKAEIEFLPMRLWIGVWLVIIALIVAGFQASTLVKYFTKFTKDIFSSLVALLFIFEAIRKLAVIFSEHPLVKVDVYCNDYGTSPTTVKPNAALMSAILMFGTFFIAYFLKMFRNGKYLGRTIRRALGDFGVPIAIVLMVLIDNLIDDTYTEKLKVPVGVQVTAPDQRGWLIPPMGRDGDVPVWLPFAAAIPAILLYLLLFMETHICELIMMEKTKKKGGGLHWDIVLLCLINCLGATCGGPWICSATVRAVSHVSALAVMSTTHAPGETAKIVDVREQRVTALVVSIMVGLSVLLASWLELVPFAVLFGVFLYMGVSSINGIQMFDRIMLLFMPVKHHPQVSYVRRVKTWKMHLYTLAQLIGLGVLWAVKSTALALFFPFFVVAMIPYRMLLGCFFTPRELNALDGPKAGQVMQDDEPDFYDQAYGA